MSWIPYALSAAGGLYASQQGDKGNDATTTTQLPGFQEDALRSMIGGAMGEVNQPYGTGNSEWLAQAHSNLWDFSQGGMQDTADQATQAWQMFLDPDQMLSPENRPGFQAMIDQITNRSNQNLSENVLPQLTNEAVASGMAGSNRDAIARGLASGRSQEALQGQIGDIFSSAYSEGLQHMQNAVSMTPMMQQVQMAPFQTALMVGQDRSNFQMNRLGQLAQMLGMNMGGSVTESGADVSSGEAGLGTFLAMLGAMNSGDIDWASMFANNNNATAGGS